MKDAKSKALASKGGKKMVRISVNKKPKEIGHTITDHKGRILEHYEPK